MKSKYKRCNKKVNTILVRNKWKNSKEIIKTVINLSRKRPLTKTNTRWKDLKKKKKCGPQLNRMFEHVSGDCI